MGKKIKKNTKILVNKKKIITEEDDDQEINNEESEGKYQRKERTKDRVELGHSEENERDELENEELIFSKKTQKEGDGDDLVNTDTDTDLSETNERDQRKHHNLHRTLVSQKIGHDEYYVATDIDMESNVTRNTDLSTSTLAATQLTENADDMV